MERILIITSNEAYGREVRIRLEGEFTTEVHSVNAAEASDLTKSDTIVLDAHASQPKQTCGVVRRVRTAREQDIKTPFVILAWLSRQDIVNPKFEENPFIGNRYEDSCRFLRFPVPPTQLIKTLEEVEPCTQEKIEEGKEFLSEIGHAH